VSDTVRFVQPAFYPELPFTALSGDGERQLRLTTPIKERFLIDRALDVAASGTSLVLAELPPMITGEVDEELANFTVAIIERLLDRAATIVEKGYSTRVDPSMIGVVCTHISQVNAIRERLPQTLSNVFIETSDRFQGLQRELMFVHHPLSGRADASQFHLDAGRLCVMMSRHRVACWLVGRAGIENRLMRYAASGDRVLGIPDDFEYDGWRAHLQIIQSLSRERRVVSFAYESACPQWAEGPF
jgi:hypothetical protein